LTYETAEIAMSTNM